jgi:hypothetical protein
VIEMDENTIERQLIVFIRLEEIFYDEIDAFSDNLQYNNVDEINKDIQVKIVNFLVVLNNFKKSINDIFETMDNGAIFVNLETHIDLKTKLKMHMNSIEEVEKMINDFSIELNNKFL